MIFAELAPSPNTVCVPTFHRWQPRHPAAARRSAGRVRRAGRKSAALPLESAAFVRVVILLAVRCVVRVAVHRLVYLLDEARVRALAVLAFGVLLRALLLSVAFAHRLLRCGGDPSPGPVSERGQSVGQTSRAVDGDPRYHTGSIDSYSSGDSNV